MTWVMFAVICVWLLVLTIIIAGLARNAGALELARSAGPIPVASVSLDAQGPADGTVIQNEIMDLIVQYRSDLRTGTLVCIFVSPGCGTCLEVMDQYVQHPSRTEEIVFFAVGPTSGGSADELRRVLNKTTAVKVDGDDAKSVMQGLNVGALPFGVVLNQGTVVKSSYIRKGLQIADLAGLAVAGRTRGTQ